jgi:hypothetical protein
MQPKFLVLEVQKITNFLELTFFLDLAGCALELPVPLLARSACRRTMAATCAPGYYSSAPYA